MRSTVYFCLILSFGILLEAARIPQPGYGYIGPACAVVDGSLYLHGVPKRQLNSSEVSLFSSYQDSIATFRSGFSSPSSLLLMDAPLVPPFCGDYDDSLEVVLASCIVRNSHVYVGEKLIRPLKIDEKRKLETFLIHRASVASSSPARKRRDLGKPTPPQRDISTLLHQFLNVNSTVTSRFLPVVSQSPLFSMEGLQSFLGSTGPAATPAALTTAPIEPSTETTTRRPTKATFKTIPPEIRRTTVAPVEITTFQQTTKQGTARTLPLNRYPSSKRTQRRKPTVAIPTTTAESIQLPLGAASPVIEETVSDPFILKLLQKALENNQLLDTLNLSGRSPPTSSVPFHGTVEETKRQQEVKLHFVSPPSRGHPQLIQNVQNPANTIPGPQPNVPFTQHNGFNAVKHKPSQKPRKILLPDEICSAHLRNEIPFRFQYN